MENIDHRILDTEKTRIGNQINILMPSRTAGRRGDEQKIIDVNGHDSKSQLMTVCVYSGLIDKESGGLPVVGPIIGRIDYGSGGGSFGFEFDIPTPAALLNDGDTDKTVFGALHISVPASRVAVFARNDANAGMNIVEEVVGPPVIGRFPDRSAGVGAFIGYSIKDSRIYRTLIWAVPDKAAAPVDLAGELAAGATRTIPIPACSRRVTFPRTPLAMTLDVAIASSYSGASHGIYAIAAGSQGLIELTPFDSFLTVTNTGASPITTGAARFELEI